MQKSILTIKDLTKKFDDKTILDNVNLNIKQGEIVALVGSSGEGKSTLLRCIAGLEKFTNGTINIDGNVGMVFQAYNLFPNLTVLKNISLSLQLVKKLNAKDANNRSLIELKMMGLQDKLNDYPSQLSGGQAQRIAIARALALDPSLILFDEPTSALDPNLKQEVLNVIKMISVETNIAILIVTHEVELVSKIANRVLELKNKTLN
jgi:polar amino acid transport system ATP-binding protein